MATLKMPPKPPDNALSPTYFTCTLGEAAELSPGSEYTTINRLIDIQAKQNSSLTAAGFAVPRDGLDEWGSEVFTFEDLYNGSVEVAGHIRSEYDGTKAGCVALLCHSSIDFLFAWLGLMRAGFSVLLIAPQCHPSAIASLCEACKVTRLYHDRAHSSQAAEAAAQSNRTLQPKLLYWQDTTHQTTSICDLVRNAKPSSTPNQFPEPSSADVAYINHSSGTSTGTPKPIPQTHHGAVGVLPTLSGSITATFTTTPLYHGGIADAFRAWTSNAVIWLFPGADAPITSKTVLFCLSTAERADTPPVKYFSSVPYILQMLAETSDGLKALKGMDIVGVGGAALPQKAGDELVEKGVNLVSRFGSAECGFLLCSHRKYGADKAWQYLRVPSINSRLRFEEQDDGSGLAELVVQKDWPHMAKRNRGDGAYATSDLFHPHPTIVDAWRYDSRSDSQITLLTGKKFDPAPLEDDIASGSSTIREVMIFGSDRQVPGALVFPVQDAKVSQSELKAHIWDAIQDVNKKGQDHSKVSKNMFVIMDANEPPLERSSKGTLLRGQAEKRYTTVIAAAYGNGDAVLDNGSDEATQDVEASVKSIIAEILGTEMTLGDDDDFYQYGVDSTRATQIRTLLQHRLVRESLPFNVVYDCGNIKGLVRYITDLRSGQKEGESTSDAQLMQDLVAQYSKFDTEAAKNAAAKGTTNGRTVLLTGATGGLGAHILDTLRRDNKTMRIICLVRATDNDTARRRVSESLTLRKKQALTDDSDRRVWCMPVHFDKPDLGLPTEVLEHIQKETTHIIHAAWAVNFSLSLKSFVNEHVAGLHHLLALALSSPNSVSFTFCSSTASVLSQAKSPQLPEEISTTPPSNEALGYSKSKWVAEALCSNASKTPGMTGRVNIVRVGQLTGDTENGVWNRSEAYPLMLSTAGELGCLPALEEKLSWLPVDVAARAVVDISVQDGAVEVGCAVYHVVNNSRETSWRDLLGWVQSESAESIEIVEPRVWLERLEKLKAHPAKSLLGLWKAAYGSSDPDTGTDPKEEITFNIKNAESASECMRGVRAVDEELVKKIWHWLNEDEN